MTHVITTLNPATGTRLADYTSWGAERIEQAVAQGHAAALQWGQQPLDVRVAAVHRLAQVLREQKTALATLMTQEMGKPLPEAAGEM